MVYEAAWGDDKYPGGLSAKFEFFYHKAGFDGLSEADFVGEKAAHRVACAGAGEGVDLVRQGDDPGVEGGEEPFTGVDLDYLCCGGAVDDLVSVQRFGTV